jgi:hypothetical protein
MEIILVMRLYVWLTVVASDILRPYFNFWHILLVSCYFTAEEPNDICSHWYILLWNHAAWSHLTCKINKLKPIKLIWVTRSFGYFMYHKLNCKNKKTKLHFIYISYIEFLWCFIFCSKQVYLHFLTRWYLFCQIECWLGHNSPCNLPSKISNKTECI